MRIDIEPTVCSLVSWNGYSVKSFQIAYISRQLTKVMTRCLHVIVLTCPLVSMNACIIANYKVSAHDSSESRTVLPVSHEEAVSIVIPRYYRVELRCSGGGGGGGWVGLIGLVDLLPGSCKHEVRDFIGTQIHDGVVLALNEVPLGRSVEFIEHIQSQGLVCVVSINEQINEDNLYRELFSLATLLVVPAYTTHNYVLSYSILSNFKLIKESQYHITEKAILGVTSWLLAPVMYHAWGDIKLGLNEYGPRASVVREITKMFLYDARRDGVL